MRLLSGDVLLGVARTHRDPGEVQPRQQLAHGALVHLHLEVPGDLVTQIPAPPAHHLVHIRLRPLADPRRERRLLRRGQLAPATTGAGPVLQACKPGLVGAMHPVSQGLPVHPRCLRRLRPGPAFQHQSQRKHPPRRSRILLSRSRTPKTCGVQARPRDRNRHDQSLPAPGAEIQTRPITATHVRVSETGGWYYTLRRLFEALRQLRTLLSGSAKRKPSS